MANMRTGFVDSYHASRIDHLKGTAYPAAPATIYLGIFSKMPGSDGTGGTEISPATRPTLTLGSDQTDGNGRQYCTNSAISNVVLTNTTPVTVTGFGVFSANSGGTPLYFDRVYPFQVAAGATINIAANYLKVFAEPRTIE